MALIECPECGGKVSDKAPACIHCGYPLKDGQQIQYCPYCGKSNDLDTAFCGYCGRELIQSENNELILKNDTTIDSVNIMDFKRGLDTPDEIVHLQQMQIIQQQQQLEEQKRQFDSQAKCPKCRSTSLSGGKQGFGVGKAVAGAVLFGGIGLLAGSIGANKTVITCMNCGYKFKL